MSRDGSYSLLMPLFDLMTLKAVERVPYKKDYDLFRSRLSTAELSAIESWIDERIAGHEVHTAGWMPGHDWRGTVLEPIYTKAAQRDERIAGRAFGLFVYARFLAHPEPWISGRFELNGRDIGSRTYFRKT